jgi:hypothetical protein
MPPDTGTPPAGPRCDIAQRFLTPTLVPAVNTTSTEVAPRLSSDELELFFTRSTGEVNGYDFFLATRDNPDADFGEPKRIDEISTTNGSEGGAFLAADNLTLFYNDGDAIAVARRADRKSPFVPGGELAGSVNSRGAVGAWPYLTQQDQVMYFSIEQSMPSLTASPYRALRAVDGTFQAPMSVDELKMTAGQGIDKNPVLSPDGLTIYWGRRTTGRGDDIWVATRESTAASFSNARADGNLSSQVYDVPGWVSADGCVVYFESDRDPNDPGGTNLVDYNLWVARRSK